MSRGLQKVKEFLEIVEDYGACVYIVFILAGLPFYFTDGYKQIGTDKSLFFRHVSWNLGMILVPVAILLLLLKGLDLFLQTRNNTTLSKNKVAKSAGTNAGISRRSNSVKSAVEEQRGCRWIDIFMGIYAVGLTLSFALSAYREEAWLGSPGWYMGFFTQLVFVGVYFLISRFWKPRRWMLYLVLPVSGVVFLLGYLDRFELRILEMAAQSEAFISTIGNINWYCGYAVCVFFVGAILFWTDAVKKQWQRNLLILYLILGFGTLMTHGSDSGVLTVAVVMLVLFCMSAKVEQKMLKFWQMMLMLSGACAISALFCKIRGGGSVLEESLLLRFITSVGFAGFVTVVSVLGLAIVLNGKKKGKYSRKFFEAAGKILACGFVGAVLLAVLLGIANTAFPGSIGKLSQYPIFTFSRSWGSWRGVTLEAAVRCIAEQDFLHKLIGVGPDAMWRYLYNNSSKSLYGMLQQYFGSSILTNAHCELLTVLVNLGVAGLVAFVGIFLSGIISFLKRGKRNEVVLACGFCLLSYTVNNIFSFQQTLNGATIFVILGIGAAFCRESKSRV